MVGLIFRNWIKSVDANYFLVMVFTDGATLASLHAACSNNETQYGHDLSFLAFSNLRGVMLCAAVIFESAVISMDMNYIICILSC